ncbi:MAG: DNA gyrase inhibitor YacG [Alphaproteobacteria bacterium]|nr:DNA gyrase inhibitor YacG [Alphaproteobacteria bacterium]
MKCPICKKEVTDLKYRPFCCKRCADIDLANWFNEEYRFQATEIDEKDLEELEKNCPQQDED